MAETFPKHFRNISGEGGGSPLFVFLLGLVGWWGGPTFRISSGIGGGQWGPEGAGQGTLLREEGKSLFRH